MRQAIGCPPLWREEARVSDVFVLCLCVCVCFKSSVVFVHGGVCLCV